MATEHRWWKANKAKVHAELLPTVRRLEQELGFEERFTDYLSSLTNRTYSGLRPGKMKFSLENRRKPRNRRKTNSRSHARINMTSNIAETLAARICGNRVKPRFLTRQGDYTLRRRAQKTDQAVDGVFHEQDCYKHTEEAYRDCEWTGLGWVKVVEDFGLEKVIIERLVPGEVLWDEDATPNGMPRMWFQRKWVPTDVLQARFPRQAQRIAEAACNDAGEAVSDRMVATELVYVVEAWKLPSRKGKKGGGLHVIACDGATLLHEEWTDDMVPLAPIAFIPARVGFVAQGLVEYLDPIQGEMDAMCGKVQGAMQVGASSRMFVEDGAVMDEAQLTNSHGDVVKLVQGGLSQVRWDTPAPISGQVFNYIQWLWDIGHESSGVSQLSSGGKIPPGVEAAVAMREMQDVETLRFTLHHRAWERLHTTIAMLVVRASRRLTEWMRKRQRDDEEEAWSYKVSVPTDGGALWEVDWDQALRDEDNYQVQCWPSNLLPQTPAGKLAMVEELLETGLINEQVAHALLDFPDLDQAQSLLASEIDLVDFQVEQILDGKTAEEVKFRSFQNSKVATQRAGQLARRAVLDSAPESVISQIEAYIGMAGKQAMKVKETRDKLAELEAMKEQGPMPPPGGPEINNPAATPGA